MRLAWQSKPASLHNWPQADPQCFWTVKKVSFSPRNIHVRKHKPFCTFSF